ncbi:hypothetical protein [Candidatus Accumulibacter aalborgensis]|nr:hypothetical protein [Candidatus Accumulibacter aalborgensis]
MGRIEHSLVSHFEVWVAANSARFPFPLRQLERTEEYGIYGLVGITHHVSVFVGNDSLSVTVEWQGQCWDMLLSLDAVGEAVEGGYRCQLCCEDHSEAALFPTLDSLWEDHLFLPFVNWINKALCSATHLWIESTPTLSATWASLITLDGEAAKCEGVALPLRV